MLKIGVSGIALCLLALGVPEYIGGEVAPMTAFLALLMSFGSLIVAALWKAKHKLLPPSIFIEIENNNFMFISARRVKNRDLRRKEY